MHDGARNTPPRHAAKSRTGENGLIAAAAAQTLTVLVAAIARLLRRQQMLRQAIGGLVIRDRLHQAIQGVGPELHAVDIGAQALNGLTQSLLCRSDC
jgi:hypothetical protein